jgi:hypothetical protein
VAVYKFLMSGQGSTFAKPYTKEGKQYYGFKTEPDGRIGFLRKGFKNPDDADAKRESTFVDYLDKNTKFYARNPSEGDFIGANFKTVQDFINTKDAPYDDKGNLIRYQGGQHRLYPAVYYENLQKWATNQNKSGSPPTAKKTDPVVGIDGKTYPSVEAMQKAMQQQDTDKLRQIGLDKGADEKFFQSSQFKQFLKENPMGGVYPSVVVNDAYGFGNSPRTNAMAKYYTNYLTDTGQQGRIKKSAEQLGFESLPTQGLLPSEPVSKDKLPKSARDKLPPNVPDGMYNPGMIARPAVMAFGYNPKTGQFVTAGSGTPDNPGDFVFKGNYESLFEMFPEAKARFEEGKRIGFSNLKPFTSTGNTNMAEKITTDAQLEQRMADLAGGLSTGVPQVTAVRPTVNANELQGTAGTQVVGDVTATTAQTPTQVMPTVPTGAEGVGQIAGLERTAPSVTTMDTAQITPTGDYMQQVQGTISPQAIAAAQTEELDERGTVRYQMAQLMSSLEEGGEMPPWASPAVRKVGAIMQARGLGASSMASAAITQAVMESGIPIATADANKYSTIQLQNLNNKQQTALTNAATFAAMDKANLSARLQSAVTNAQALLSVDTANLTAEQQTNTLNYNALTQAMFKDAAEENARREFNAKNELQVQEFFAELGSQVETANANRTAAINQFNVGEANAMNQFNASMQDARDKFNSNMQYAVDQSNVNWRRQVNTADTAIQNETNRINVQNLFNMNQSALNALWQKYRDNAAWNFQKSESALQRQHEIGIMAMEFANSKETYTQQQKDSIGIGVGNWLATWAAM